MARLPQNTAPAEGEVITVGTLSIDLAQRRVSRKDQVLDLTHPLLFELLVYLVRHRGMVLTRAQLLAQVWGYETPDELMGDTHTVSVHIRLSPPTPGGKPGRSSPLRRSTYF
jgi:DNA-binding response OmpR family regulator